MKRIEQLMKGLAAQRPIFHSEADFQFALAWEIQKRNPTLQVRLERPFEGESDSRRRLDIFVKSKSDYALAIELKYLTKKFEDEIEGEEFSLQNQSASAIRRYNVVKDIERLETIVFQKPLAYAGLAIVLTNDGGYWNKPRKKNTIDAAFRLDTDRKYLPSGKLSWSKDTSEGTKDGREDDIHLKHEYRIGWKKYPGGYGFRYLAIPVGENEAIDRLGLGEMLA